MRFPRSSKRISLVAAGLFSGLLALVSVGATCYTEEDLATGPVPNTPAGSYTHESSKMEFPMALGQFTRVEVTKFDSFGKDVGVGYNLATPESAIAATVYVYPLDEDFAEEFESIKSDVVGEHGQVEVISDGAAVSISNPEQRGGLGATFRFEQSFGGLMMPVRSDLYLFTLEDWFVEYRFTYPEETAEPSGAQISDFMASLSWPEL